MIDKIAAEIAKEAHKGQVDKAGKDYFLGHLTAVGNSFSTPVYRAIGFLHDVLEDTDYTETTLTQELLSRGADEEEANLVVSIVKILTRKEDVSYNEYIRKIKDNDIARKIKIADMKHNSDLGRLDNVNDNDLKRTEKYLKKINYLESVNQ